MTSADRAAARSRLHARVRMLCAGTLWHGYATGAKVWAGQSRRRWWLWSINATVGRISTPCCGLQVVSVKTILLGWERFGFETTAVTDLNGRGAVTMCVRTPVSTWSKTSRAETLFSGLYAGHSRHTSQDSGSDN